ncbi:MAG: sn-glycerol-3-phosphate ABC transporter ATP-binding protein UgpC [Rhodobacteraceae bacterium]|nr:sn-glycerol-3-phosphate ABC transporter ATP-binding protein UgpC [Paracoccaceae bacterium]
MARITLDRVSRVYGSGAVGVHEITLDVADGEFLILLGPSGCGKSTTLRMIAGLEEVTSGRILIDGRDVTGLRPRDRNLAVVFQSYALYPTMTVRANIGFGLKMRGMATDAIGARVEEAATLLGLSPYLDRKPAALSGGQRQRVALGRAIVREPEAFLLDEPLSNLDAQLRAEMRAELVRLHRSLGRTIIHVTHDQVEAMTMGDRICILRAGRIEQVGAPLQVYANPANMFVAQFLASPPMNFLPARLEPDEGLALDLAPGLRWPVPAAHDGWGRASNSSVALGLRPEDIHPHPAAGRVPFDVEAIAVEALGPETIVTGRIRAAPHLPALKVRLGRGPVPRLGETLVVHADLSAAHLFDPESGRVIPRLARGAVQ